MDWKLSPNIQLKSLMKIFCVFDLKRRTLIKKKTPRGWLVFIMKPWNGSFIFKLFSNGDQLKIKLANLKFPKIGDGP